jgi:ABC-2 type transport system permease protein
MFTLLFTFLFGGAISGNIQSYLPIVIPGVLLMSSFTNCTTAGSKLREDVDKGITSLLNPCRLRELLRWRGV